MLDGEAPAVEILSPTVLRYSWSKPNPEFLPALAGARPLYLYRPAHYLKAVHEDYADPATLQQLVAKHHQRNWAALHRSEEHTSELQSLMRISYAVFCLKKKTTPLTTPSTNN